MWSDFIFYIFRFVAPSAVSQACPTFQFFLAIFLQLGNLAAFRYLFDNLSFDLCSGLYILIYDYIMMKIKIIWLMGIPAAPLIPS